MPISETKCPLCNENNDCALADKANKANANSDTFCWCFGQCISNEVLDRILLEQRGRACICYQCASAKKADSLA